MKKTIFITGTSSGMGKAAAKLFASRGWNVIATMRSPEKEQELTQIENILVTKLDVQNLDSIEKAIHNGIDRFGKIDALVNNAGYGLVGVFENVSREQIARHFEVNLFGLMDVTRSILPHFRKNGHGTIVNLSSMGGRVTFPILSLYHASKFAVEGFSESLAYELLTANIKVKIIEPGSVKTNFSTTSVDFAPNNFPAYEQVIMDFMSKYPGITEKEQKASAEDVAQVIYDAVHDETSQLRYPVGGDAEFYLKGKEAKTDQNYVNQMRSYFIGS